MMRLEGLWHPGADGSVGMGSSMLHGRKETSRRVLTLTAPSSAWREEPSLCTAVTLFAAIPRQDSSDSDQAM